MGCVIGPGRVDEKLNNGERGTLEKMHMRMVRYNFKKLSNEGKNIMLLELEKDSCKSCAKQDKCKVKHILDGDEGCEFEEIKGSDGEKHE